MAQSRKWLLSILLLSGACCLCGCEFLAPREQISIPTRNINANQIAEQGSLHRREVITPSFKLVSYQPDVIVGDTLRIYIEGDGHAWGNSQTVSDDPTPINPISLRLAIADPSKASVYLARPCQFQDSLKGLDQTQCPSRYWANERYSKVVVDSLNLAIDQLKRQYHAKQVMLIGYSGGGTLAILCAAKRDDVSEIVTIAGNVSVRAWTQEMGLAKLNGSLDPVDYAQNVSHIPQWHFIGEKDEIVPAAMMNSYLTYFPKDSPIKVITIKNFGHQCCWDEQWPFLLKQIQ